MDTPLESSLTRYIWKHTKRQQIWVLCIVLLSMIPYFLAFDLPKQIVNGPLQGMGFKNAGDTQTFMHISFSLPGYGTVEVFQGLQLDRMSLLFALSFVFLALVIVNGLFKFYINTYKGRLGERLLRRIRFDLVDRVLRFPPATFKRVKSAEIASMVKDEVEPLGGFTGDAFVSPLFLGGQALTALAFIFMQNLWLGLITAALVSVQGVLIPRLRRRLLVLGRERQVTAREFAGRVGEIVDGIGAIHAFDTSNFERADVATRLGRIFRIRYDIYQWKFLVKFINNFLASVTPFLFYSVGGYLTLKGHLDLGQLVAVIGAYKDLPSPLKELIDWDQARQDVEVKYHQVVGQFAVSPLIAAEIQQVDLEGPRFTGEVPLAVTNLTLADDSGGTVVNHVSLKFSQGEHVAMVGKAAGGAEALAEAIGRQVWPASGRITLDDQDLLSLPESVSGRALTYVAAEGYFFYGTLGENLLYGVKHAPLRETETDEEGQERRDWEIREAARAGTPYFDLSADWLDYRSVGAAGPEDLMEAIFPALEAAELSNDILTLAVRSVFDLSGRPELTDQIVELRGALYHALDAAGLSGLIVPYDPRSYNTEASVGENLLFGNPTGSLLSRREVAKDPYFRGLVIEMGLNRDLFEMGREIAANTIELFGDLPPDHPFFQQLTFMTAEELPDYQQRLQRVEGLAVDQATPEDRVALIGLSFSYIEPRHRFGLLSDELMARVVEFRRRFREGLPAYLEGEIEFYDPDRYMTSATMQVNMLFGRVSQRHPNARERIYVVLRDLLKEGGLYMPILTLGLDYHIGSGGRRLSAVQRQKLALARALMRQSAYFVFNRPLSSLDRRLQEQVTRNALEFLRANGRNPGVIWVLGHTGLADLFDRVIVFEQGQPVEDGTIEALANKSDIFKELMSA